MSRPSESVPIQCLTSVLEPSAPRTVCSDPGVLLRNAGLISAGSSGVKSGAARPMAVMSTRIAAPMTTTGLRSNRRATPRRTTGGAPSGASSPIESAVRLITNPRIERRVRDVDQQVYQHVHEREEQDHGLHGRVVAREHGIDRQPTEAGDREHA